MKFNSAIFVKPNLPLEIVEVENNRIEFGQVLVKVIKSGLCGAQLQEIRGEKNPNLVPRLIGHEGVGIVQEIGLGVKTVKPGDKVVMHWRQGSGIESDFPSYTINGQKKTSGLIVTLSEYAVVSENRVTRVPTETENDMCALLGCGISTALATINNKADVKFGESVLVLGCGGVGLSLIFAARLAGAHVFGIDTVDKTKIVSSVGGNFTHETNEKFDVIIDTTGNVGLINRYVNNLSKNGRFILVGQPKNWADLTIPSKVLFDGEGLSISATQAGGFNPDRNIPEFIKALSGRNYGNIITDRLSLHEINKAFDILKTGTAGRIVIDICK